MTPFEIYQAINTPWLKLLDVHRMVEGLLRKGALAGPRLDHIKEALQHIKEALRELELASDEALNGNDRSN